MNRKKSFANLLKITCVMVCSCIGTQLVWADKTNSESITDTAMGTDCSVRVFGSDGTAKDIMDMLSDIENKYLSWRIEGSDIANINENASESEPVMPSNWTYGYLENVLDLARKSSGASADWAQSRQKFFLDNISHSPVWNSLGETEDFFLTFYAKK